MAQAIEINREVGGDLAEVLDQVGETIRERSQIKGHVKALSAEGKLSAYILMALPIHPPGHPQPGQPRLHGQPVHHPVGWVLMRNRRRHDGDRRFLDP